MYVKSKLITSLVFIVTLCLVLPVNVYAHGARIEYTSNVEIEIVAKYDSGEPMGRAQVVVYAPDNLSTPWLTGICDDEGVFAFKPDSNKPGTWDIQVRQAGHGDIVHIPIGEGGATAGSSGGYSVIQIVLMSVCVIWGFTGTGLYFIRKRA